MLSESSCYFHMYDYSIGPKLITDFRKIQINQQKKVLENQKINQLTEKWSSNPSAHSIFEHISFSIDRIVISFIICQIWFRMPCNFNSNKASKQFCVSACILKYLHNIKYDVYHLTLVPSLSLSLSLSCDCHWLYSKQHTVSNNNILRPVGCYSFTVT